MQTQQAGAWRLINDVCLGEGKEEDAAALVPLLVRTVSYSSLCPCA